MPETRIDPADGLAYTFQEITGWYRSCFSEKEIADYWADECISENEDVANTFLTQGEGEGNVLGYPVAEAFRGSPAPLEIPLPFGGILTSSARNAREIGGDVAVGGHVGNAAKDGIADRGDDATDAMTGLVQSIRAFMDLRIQELASNPTQDKDCSDKSEEELDCIDCIEEKDCVNCGRTQGDLDAMRPPGRFLPCARCKFSPACSACIDELYLSGHYRCLQCQMEEGSPLTHAGSYVHQHATVTYSQDVIELTKSNLQLRDVLLEKDIAARTRPRKGDTDGKYCNRMRRLFGSGGDFSTHSRSVSFEISQKLTENNIAKGALKEDPASWDWVTKFEGRSKRSVSQWEREHAGLPPQDNGFSEARKCAREANAAVEQAEIELCIFLSSRNELGDDALEMELNRTIAALREEARLANARLVAARAARIPLSVNR